MVQPEVPPTTNNEFFNRRNRSRESTGNKNGVTLDNMSVNQILGDHNSERSGPLYQRLPSQDFSSGPPNLNSNVQTSNGLQNR
jgi:hypothetical protein